MLKNFYNKFKRLQPSHRRFWGLLVTLLISWLIGYGLFSIANIGALEWRLIDAWIHRTGNTVPSNETAVIGIDPKVLEELEWPIEKDVYAELIDYLVEKGARVIVLDILFSHNFSACDTSDAIFRAYIEAVPNTILIYTPEPTNPPRKAPIAKPLVDPRYALKQGHIPEWAIHTVHLPYREIMALKPQIAQHCLVEPPDGSFRQVPMFVSSGGWLYPHVSLLSYMLLKNSTDFQWSPGERRLALGGKKIPVDRLGQMMINFKYKIPFYPFSRVRESHRQMLREEPQDIDDSAFKDKIVFIGTSDPTLGDNGINPMSYTWDDGMEPKVFLHARSAATLIGGEGIRLYGRLGAVLFTLLILIVFFSIFFYFQVRTVYLLTFLILTASYFIGAGLYSVGLAVPMVEGLSTSLLFTILASLVLFLEKDLDRSFLFDSFKTYLSEAVIEDMYKRQVKPKLGGSEGIRTAYFTDIQSFSTFSEKIGSPTRLVELLNEYLSAMTDILLENRGTLDKYEGDAIIAFFGAPVEMPDHAAKACIAAIRMQEKLGDLRAKWKSEGDKWPVIVHQMRMRIGINTGPLVTGNMGSHVRMNYTMMGDAVNLAARLESGAKQYGVFTLVSGETMSQASRAIYGRQIDRIRVVGKSDPVEIWEVLGLKENITPEHMRLIGDFKNGRQLYMEQNWDEAILSFTRCLELEPHHPDREAGCKTTPSHVYLARCEAYRANPPGEGWDGVYTATEK